MNITVVTKEKLDDDQLVELLGLFALFFEVPIDQILIKERESKREIDELYSMTIYSKTDSELNTVKSKRNQFKYNEFISGASPNLDIITNIYIDFFDALKIPEERNKGKNSNKGIMIGISVGLVVVLVIVGIMVWKIKKLMKSNEIRRRNNLKRHERIGNVSSVRMASSRGRGR